MSKTAVVTGITGQDGAYLAKFLLEKDYNVVGLTRGYNRSNLSKLEKLGIVDRIKMIECDLTDFSRVLSVLSSESPDEIYNLAAQSSVGLSFEQPIGTIGFNTNSVLNILEGIRITGKNKIRFYQASSSDIFGNIETLPITEETVIKPVSPYAVSKAAAHWITVNYREAYKIFSCCGILFNHESELRDSNFYIKKVISHAVDIKLGKREKLHVGNIDVKRDFGYGPEYIKAMWMMLQNETPRDYIICSGKSYSLRDILYHILDKLELDKSIVVEDPALYRPTDIKNIYGDCTKAKEELSWHYDRDFMDVLDQLVEYELNER
jgi:GDPmannose 4,6-dehydratase